MADYVGPTYMRFGRLAAPIFNDKDTYKFELGKGVQLRDGDDITIVATGLMVAQALEAADALKGQGINARVINIHTIKPIDKDIIIKAAKETGKIVTVEEHSIIGGLGSAVCDVLCENYPFPLQRSVLWIHSVIRVLRQHCLKNSAYVRIILLIPLKRF